jgi:hypothetical protein
MPSPLNTRRLGMAMVIVFIGLLVFYGLQHWLMALNGAA